MLDFVTIFSWCSVAVFVLFGTLVRAGGKGPRAQAYALIPWTLGSWTASQATFYVIASTAPESTDLLLFLNRLNHYAAASVGPLFFYFASLYPSEHINREKLRTALIAMQSILAPLYLASSAVIANVYPISQSPLQYAWDYGPLGWLFYLHFVLFFFAGVARLVHVARQETYQSERADIILIVGGMLLGSIAALFLGAILPRLGIFTYARLAPSSTLIWAGCAAYAIARYQTLNIKVVATEVALIVMGVLLALFAFAPEARYTPIEIIRALFPQTITVTPYAAVNWISGVIFSSFAILLLTGSGKPSSKVYALLSLAIAAWAFGMGMYYMVDDKPLLLFLNRWNHYFGALVGPLLYYFSLLYPTEKHPKRSVGYSIFALEIVLAYIYLGTGLIIQDSLIVLGDNLDKGWIFGPLGFIFHLNFAVFFIAGLYRLYSSYRTTRDTIIKTEVGRILVATALGSIIGVTVAVILPSFGLFRYTWLGPTLTLSWVLVTAYTIAKYHILSVKVIVAEIAVLLMMVILFVNIFLPETANLLSSGTGIGSIDLGVLVQGIVAGTSAISGYTATNWIAGLVFIGFAIMLMTGSSKPSSKVYALLSLSVAMWAFGVGIFYLVYDTPSLTLISRSNYFFGGLVGPLLYYFSRLYPHENRPGPTVLSSIVCAQLIMAYLHFGTDLIISDVTVGAVDLFDKRWVFGPGIGLFHLNFLGFFGAGLYHLYRQRAQSTSTEESLNLKRILLTTTAGSAIALVVGIVLPWFGVMQYTWLGPPLTLSWVLVTTYAITRYKLLSVKVLVAEVLVLAMAILVFANSVIPKTSLGNGSYNILLAVIALILATAIFFYHRARQTKNNNQSGIIVVIVVILVFLFGGALPKGAIQFSTVSRAGIFISFAIVGWFFVKNIIKNEEQKEELAAVNKKLSDLNDHLAQKVVERTREIEAATRHTEAVVENFSQGLLELSPNLIVLNINQTAEAMLGVSRKDVVGVRIEPRNVADRALSTLAAVTFPIASEKSKKISVDTPFGVMPASEISTTYPFESELEVVTTPLKGSGRESSLLKVIRDISREKLISRSKSEFISIAAHQMRTPLSGLKWSFGLLEDGTRGVLSSEAASLLGKAREINERLIALVRDLLAVTQIEDGNFGYVFVTQPIETTLAPLLKEYKSRTEALGLAFDSSIASTREFAHDPEKTRLALTNLLDNAIHYTKKGGVALAVTESGDICKITITDTGVGIPPNEQPRLFAKFFRGNQALRINTEGSGLGLYIANNIAHRHGGSIAITSQEGVGTTATYTLTTNPNLIPASEQPITDIL